MDEMKRCTKCGVEKIKMHDFYLCSGRYRSECKACTNSYQIKWQKDREVWKTRFVDEDARKEYARTYYSTNKEKFRKYREEFKRKNPDYYKNYFRDRKEKKGA